MTELYLRSNNIGDVGATAIGSALAVNAPLTTLGLRGNSIGDAAKGALRACVEARQGLSLYL